MNWEECIRLNMVEKRTLDRELAKSLLKIAVERFKYFDSKDSSVFTLEGLYEAILELCHALMALEGLKTVSHECAIEFVRNRYFGNYETELLQKLRKKRHGIKYYGTLLSDETVKSNLEKSRMLFLKLKKMAEDKLKEEPLKQ